MIADLIAGLVRANLAAAVAVYAVVLLRKPARRAFGARAAYLLWLAPVLAAAAALVPPASAPAPLMAPVTAYAVAVAAGVEVGVAAAPRLPAVLFGLWVAGGMAAAAVLLWRQARYMAAIGRREAGPAVVGAFRPRIVTPADFETRFDAAEREVILAHEGAHLRAGDARINALAAAALCACWFNPLVHLGVYLMRLDQELACDAAVLGRFPRARRLYAEVLLKTQLATQPLPFGCHWPAAAEHPLKERIVMLKSPLPAPARRFAGVAVVALLSAAGAAAAWAAQPGQPTPALPRIMAPDAARNGDVPADAPATITEPQWIDKPTGDDIARLYPGDAAKRRISAQVTITCRVGPDGRLAACAVARSVADGAPDLAMDFGTASLKLAQTFRMAPQTPDGVATAGGVVRIPVRWAPPAATPNTLTQAEAIAQATADDQVLCKPGTDWTQKNCRIVHGKTFDQVATAADIAREYPAAARKAGLTARVMLECAPNLAKRMLEGCMAVRVTPIDGPAPPAAMNGAFEQAAIRVAGKYRFTERPAAGDGKLFFMTVDFSDHPVLAGERPMAPVTGPGPHGPILTVMPDWIARPTGVDVVAAYPPAAAAAKQEGRATITCRVDGDGRLNKCQMINEAPEGAGFGGAALSLAARFQMKPIDKNGRATAGQDVRIPFKFLLPSAPAA